MHFRTPPGTPWDKRVLINGAVQMPNGPFYVLGGYYGVHRINRTATLYGVENPGTPMYLYVGWNGNSSGPNRYVFGLRGYINY
jgi:hypothetical protein